MSHISLVSYSTKLGNGLYRFLYSLVRAAEYDYITVTCNTHSKTVTLSVYLQLHLSPGILSTHAPNNYYFKVTAISMAATTTESSYPLSDGLEVYTQTWKVRTRIIISTFGRGAHALIAQTTLEKPLAHVFFLHGFSDHC